MSSHDKALNEIRADYLKGRKAEIKTIHASGQYATGEKMTKGKTKAQLKAEKKAAWKNRRSDPHYKALSNYSTDTSNAPQPKKDPHGWAGRVGLAHLRNQKAEHEKGYREDYR